MNLSIVIKNYEIIINSKKKLLVVWNNLKQYHIASIISNSQNNKWRTIKCWNNDSLYWKGEIIMKDL